MEPAAFFDLEIDPTRHTIQDIGYHITKHGRLGTGHGKGGGIQPEILQLQPDYFKKQMRWILGSECMKGIGC